MKCNFLRQKDSKYSHKKYRHHKILDMKQFIPLLFLAFFLAFLAGANIYLARRFSVYFDLQNTRPLYFGFGFLTVFMIAGIAFFTNAEGSLVNLAYCTASIIMGFLLYLLLSVVATDLLRLIVKTKPQYYGIAALSLAVLISGAGIWNAMHKRVRQVDLTIHSLNREITAVQLSDIHIGHFWGAKSLQKIVDQTNALSPDLVFITGDLFDGRIRLNTSSVEPLKQMNAPIYFVEGNHDGYSGAAEIKKMLREIGVHVLENEVAHFDELQIIGLDHMRADNGTKNSHAPKQKSTIQSTLNRLNIAANQPTILLHHSPDGIEYANQHGIDLYLAGHTHNGQLFPFNFVVKMVYKYNKGLHNYKGTNIYVSQGTGTFGPPMRVGTISEITQFNLKPHQQ